MVGVVAKYQQYVEYKDSGVEWLGKVPTHWNIKRIKETAQIINGYPFDSEKFDPINGTPLVRIRDINSNETQVFFNGSVPKEALIFNSDILIGMDGDFNVSQWKGGEAALNQRVCCLRSNDTFLTKFLSYLLPTRMKIINDLTYFTTVKHLSSTDILKTVYAIPNKIEYANIANFLDHETAQIDSLIAKQEKLIELLKEKRQAVISHAVTKGLNPDVNMKDSGVEWLGQVPEHWLKTKLVGVADGTKGCFVNGPFGSDLLANELQDEGVPVVYIRDIKPTGYKRKSTVHVTEQKAQQLEVCKVSTDDVIISKVGDPPGDACLYPMGEPDAIITQDVIRIRVDKSKFDPKFIVYLLNSDFGRLVMDNISVEGTRKRVSLGDFKDARFIFPHLKEQQLIAEHLDNECNAIDSIMNRAQHGISLIQERRTALIYTAVTGKIDVQNWQNPTEAKMEFSA